jgi:peptidoglycan/xylan/chitin deacetylase (PgdA/CDA1 family)
VSALPFQGQVVTAGAGANVSLDAFGLAPFSLTGKMLKLTFTINDPSKIGNLSLFVGTGSLSNNIRWRFDTETASSKLAKPGEVTTVTLQLSEINTVAGAITLSPTGVPSVTSGFTDIRFQASDNTTGPITVQLLSVQIVEPRLPGAFVSIVFDDANESIVSRAFPKMQSLGLAGTSYVIVDALGTTGKTTLEGQQTLAATGWEIGGHAFTTAGHLNGFTALTAQQVDDELSGLHDWLAANFRDSQGQYSFAYPLGKYENTTDGASIESLVAANGFTNARTILSDVGVSTHVQVESLPPAMPFRMNAMSGLSSLTAGQYIPSTLVATGGMLDKVAANGGWLILVFHKVVGGTPAATTEISQSDFDLIMDNLAVRNLTVAPVRDVLRYTPADVGGTANYYRVEGQTASITPTLGGVWLKSIARPFLNRKVTVRDVGDVVRPTRSGTFEVVGRSYPVAVTDVRSSRRWTLDLSTYTPQEASDLDLILASGDILLVHVPTTGLESAVPGGYVAAGDVTVQMPPTDDLAMRIFSVPCTEVAAPGPDVVGATSNWQTVISTYGTWSDLIAAKATWSDVLELVGSPTDVVVP